MDSLRVRGATDLPSYMAASVTYSATATASIVFEISNPSTSNRLVRVHRVLFSAIQTTAGNIGDWRLERRAAASGGTSASMTAVPADSSQLPATAVCRNYTAEPTPGALTGIIFQPRVLVPQASSVVNPATVLDFDTRHLLNGRPVTLRAGQALSLNFGGGALPTGLASCQASVYWTEEPLTSGGTAFKAQ